MNLDDEAHGEARHPQYAILQESGMKIRQWVKSRIMYKGLAETDDIRRYLAANGRSGWPYCPPDEGDLLFHLARSRSGNDALEVGFATGSTATYIMLGLESGQLTSIDYDQNHYEREGVRIVASMGFTGKHRLIEQDSIRALPELHGSGRRFGLVFLDGWKTFDRLWVDTFYCARMLSCNGYLVFDDARMPAVRKCISLLKNYYGFMEVDGYAYVGGWKQKLWHLLSTRSVLRPYVALRKTVEVDATEAGSRFDFWKRF